LYSKNVSIYRKDVNKMYEKLICASNGVKIIVEKISNFKVFGFNFEFLGFLFYERYDQRFGKKGSKGMTSKN
jgi:hypothetical protein